MRGKQKTDKQLKALGARIDAATSADEFADAVCAVIGVGGGSVAWAEARAMWSLIKTGAMTRKQALTAVAARLSENIQFASDEIKAVRASLPSKDAP